MWTVVYIAASLQVADRLKAVLEREGILVSVRALEVDSQGRGSVELSVPEGEAEEAQELLTAHLGGMG